MTPDVAASVHQRLLNRARIDGRPFNELLQYYVLERFLYRLGQSKYADRFVLKGALLFSVWYAPLSRPTRDVDLLGRLSNQVEQMVAIMQQICLVPGIEEDGLVFHIWLLAHKSEFDGALLGEAIAATFAHRRTQIPATPLALTAAFSERPDKNAQWHAFTRRHPQMTNADSLSTVISEIAAFLCPLLSALAEDQPFQKRWIPDGPWRPLLDP